MKRTEYLYGCSPKEWATLPYVEALKVRIKKAKELKSELVEKVFNTTIPSDDNEYEKWSSMSTRCNEVQKAIEFNEVLLKEIEDKHFQF